MDVRHTEERLARVGPSGEIEIAYDEIGPSDGEPMLLLMGLGTQLIHWDPRFCALLAERGFRVIRMDNRDVGHSTRFAEAKMPSRLTIFLGRRKSAAYTLMDMAADSFGLLDHLEIGTAHIVGVSMGARSVRVLARQSPSPSSW